MRVASSSQSSLFATPAFLRLWAVGGLASAVLWLEVLAASLFTFDVTGSATAVAFVSAARAAPLLGVGALAGVLADAWNRKAIVMAGLALSSAAAATIAVLAALGLAHPWHLGLAALVSGSVYATELPARRRMVVEAGGPGRTEAAVAVDSLTSYAARCVGPVLGGLIYQRVGLAGAFCASAICNGIALIPIVGLAHAQPNRPLALGGVVRDLREAAAFALKTPAILLLLAVTTTMNLCGYSYSTLIAPLAKTTFALDGTMTGVLAAAEPAGAFVAGLVLTRVTLRGSKLGLLMGGVVILTAGVVLGAGASLAGLSLTVVLVCFAAAGVGSAIYNNQQTSIAVGDVPVALRSRVMGLVTVCIGSWPFGMILAGELARQLDAARGLVVLCLSGLVLVSALAGAWAVVQRRRKPSRAPAWR